MKTFETVSADGPYHASFSHPFSIAPGTQSAIISGFLSRPDLATLIRVKAPDPNASPTESQPPPGVFTFEEIGRMRREYCQGGLDRDDLQEDPFAQFELWFKQACDNRLLEPNAMSLATTSEDGRPALRTVLLKGFDHRGFAFFTNLESRKSRHIAANPNVALLFPWLALERQVIILGQAEKLSTAEVLKYFLSRPLGSQLAAWSSPQSRIITSRGLLEMKLAEMKRKFSDGKVPLPSFWGGYRVVPRSFEFWQGRPNRLHDRFLYSRQPDQSWAIERLAP